MPSEMHSPPGAEATIDGRRYLYFAGTAYLGLQGHPAVIEAACDAARRYGLGSATTRAWFGTMPPVSQVEQLAARYFDADDAFYFASGYLTNHLLVQALADSVDAVFVDQHAHYCVGEAARLTGKPVTTFAHRMADDLARQLKRLPAQARPLVLSDGVFSVQGTLAPVPDYLRVLASYPGARLVLDDAHGLGVLGANGRGTFEHFGIAPVNTPAATCWFGGTLSKALGGFGGIVAGSPAFVDTLKRLPMFAGASAPAAPAAAGSARALQIVLEEPALRQRLRENVALVRHGLSGLGLPVPESPTPIVCLELDSAEQMRRVQATLAERGIMIAYAASYSGVGPKGALRLAVCALHTPAMIEQLVDEFRRVL